MNNKEPTWRDNVKVKLKELEDRMVNKAIAKGDGDELLTEILVYIAKGQIEDIKKHLEIEE